MGLYFIGFFGALFSVSLGNESMIFSIFAELFIWSGIPIYFGFLPYYIWNAAHGKKVW
jgi:hypothetical protein